MLGTDPVQLGYSVDDAQDLSVDELRELPLDRHRKCGRFPILPTGEVAIRTQRSKQHGRTVAHFSGLGTCGSVWMPCCAPKILAGRADEVERAITEHWRRGGEVLFFTGTMSHVEADSLADSFDALRDTFQDLTAGGWWTRFRKRWGVSGYIRAVEITRGGAGWHVHVHCLLFLCSSEEDYPAYIEGDLVGIQCALFGRWAYIARNRYGREVNIRHGLDLQLVTRGNATEVGHYVAKLEDGRSMALEMLRGDLKKGRLTGSIHPHELLDLVHDQDPGIRSEARRLWREYERTVAGRRMMTWSHGLRASLLDSMTDLSDQELAEAEVGGVVVALIPSDLWRQLRVVPGALGQLLRAAEDGGFAAIERLCVQLIARPG